jgi:inositol-phosphate phosphatase / L-galactose 1-phosphate phosphatase / histidinol-phosphatase
MHFRATTAYTLKPDSSPVSEADVAVENALISLIQAQFPEHGIFGEENNRINPHAPYQWVLDPIDGTRSFMAGYPLFTTLIALCENGVPILGVIDQPILRERWLGARGLPTQFNGSPCSVARPDSGAPLTLASTSMRYFTPHEAEIMSKLCANFVPSGDGYAYAMLASGQLHAVVDGYMKPYDYMAHAPIIEGAGGVITDWAGKPITLYSNGKVLAACTERVHKQLLEKLP